MAVGNGWGLGSPALRGSCDADAICTVGDVDGDEKLELVGFRPGKQGDVYYVKLGAEPKLNQELPWHGDFCTGDKSQCQVADVTGNGLADLVWMKPNGGVAVALNQQGQVGSQLDLEEGTCSSDICQLADVDGDKQVELVAQTATGAIWVYQLSSADFGKRSLWRDSSPGSQQRFSFSDVLGNGFAELLIPEQDGARVYISGESGFVPSFFLNLPSCGSGSRCFWADAVGNGRSDYWLIRAAGDLVIYPYRDRLEVLEANALSLSQLAQRRGRYQRKTRDELFRLMILEAVNGPPSWDGTFSGDDSTWPDLDAVDEATFNTEAPPLITAINTGIGEVFGALPTESELTDLPEQRRFQRAVGRIIAARTTLFAGDMGATKRAGIDRCGNVVLHDEYLGADGEHVEPSYFGRYYDAFRLPEQPQRVEATVGALTAIWEGTRCLSQDELARLEAAYVEALVVTMLDLKDRGHPILARRMWDRSLPLSLVLFDAVHHFAVPQTWRLLQLKSGSFSLPDGPTPGFDFAAAAADSACDTLWCQFYRHESRGPGGESLTLDEIGLWLPNLQNDWRMERFNSLGEHIIPGLLDLRHLGEGDCALFEVVSLGFTCPSDRTCNAPDEAAAPTVSTLEPQPGMPGSEFSHLNTDRATLPSENDCASGGGSPSGGPIAGCGGPPLRSMSGRFSVDPAIDRIFRCGMKTASGIQSVTMDFSVNPDCLLGQGGTSGAGGAGGVGGTAGMSGGGGTGGESHEATNAVEDSSTQNEHLNLWTNGSGAGHDRAVIVQKMIEAFAAQGQTVSAATIISYMERLAPDYFGAGRSKLVPGNIQGRAFATVSNPETGESVIYFNEQAIGPDADRFTTQHGVTNQAYVDTALIHEFIHVVIDQMTFDDELDTGVWFANPDLTHSEIHRPLNLHNRSCGTDGGACGASCGLAEALARRLSDCLEEARPATPADIRCDFQVDYCADRVNGGVNGFSLGNQCHGLTRCERRLRMLRGELPGLWIHLFGLLRLHGRRRFARRRVHPASGPRPDAAKARLLHGRAPLGELAASLIRTQCCFMSLLHHARALAIISIIFASAACAEDDTSAGTGGAAGTTTGGSSGLGGTGGIDASTAGSGGQDSGTAGTSGTTATDAGDDASVVSCPPSKPGPGVSCSQPGAQCAYGSDQCGCAAGNFGGDWKCSTCPATAPASDTACTEVSLRCNYAGQQCTCFNSGEWKCHDCPDTPPSDGTTCTPPGAACAYGGNKCLCIGGKWSCYTSRCPPQKPETGIGCFAHANGCNYDGGSCGCGGIKTWFCPLSR